MVKINADEYFLCIGCLITSLACLLSVCFLEGYHLSLFAFIHLGLDCCKANCTTLSLGARDAQDLPSNR